MLNRLRSRQSERQPLQSATLATDAAELSSDHRWFQEHYFEAANQTLEFLAGAGISMSGKDVADVGSGDGIIDLGLVHRGRPSLLVGYDLQLTSREILAEKASAFGVCATLPCELRFEQSGCRRVPAEDDSYDIIVTWSAFEHISDPVTVCREMRRILRPHGVVFLQLWPFYFSERGSHLWDWFPEAFHHLQHDQEEVLALMRDSGVHDDSFTRYMADEFVHLNRLTLEGLHRSLLAGGFRVARLELISGAVEIPAQLSHHSLADLAISGVKLLAV